MDPTQMRMAEVNYSQKYTIGQWQFMNSFSWYSLKQIGILERIKTKDDIGVKWTNTGKVRRIQGIEDFLRVQRDWFSGFLSLYSIFPQQQSTAANGEKYTENIPLYKVKLGVSFDFLEHFQLNVFADHWGETKWEMDNYDSENRTILEGTYLHTQNASTIINTNVRIVNISLDETAGMKFDITLAVDNVTNEQFTHHLRPWVAMGHLQPPRKYWAKLGFHF